LVPTGFAPARGPAWPEDEDFGFWIESDDGLVPKLPLWNAPPAKLPLRLRTPSEQSTRAPIAQLGSGASRTCVPKRELGNERNGTILDFGLNPSKPMHTASRK